MRKGLIKHSSPSARVSLVGLSAESVWSSSEVALEMISVPAIIVTLALNCSKILLTNYSKFQASFAYLPAACCLLAGWPQGSLQPSGHLIRIVLESEPEPRKVSQLGSSSSEVGRQLLFYVFEYIMIGSGFLRGKVGIVIRNCFQI